MPGPTLTQRRELHARLSPSGAISSELLDAAKLANDHHMDPILQLVAVITPNNYTMGVLSVFLHHLRDDPTTVPHHIMASRISIACFSATQGLCHAIQNCPEDDDSPLRKATVRELLLRHKQILAWFEFILTSPIVEHQSKIQRFDLRDPIRLCTTLGFLLGCDIQLSDALRSSDSIYNLLLTAWNFRDHKGDPYISFEGFVDGCQIVTLLRNLASIPSSRQRLEGILFDTTPDSDRLQDLCIESAIARLRCIKKLDRKAMTAQLRVKRPIYYPSPVDASLRYIRMLNSGIFDLTRNPVMQSKLFKSDYPKVLMEALEIWVVGRSHKTLDREYRRIGWEALNEALFIQLEEQKSLDPWRRQSDMARKVLLQMIQGGLLSILADALESCTLDSDPLGWEAVLSSLTLLKGHLAYPTVVCRGAVALSELRGDRFHEVKFLHENGNEPYWRSLCNDVMTGRRIVSDEPKLIPLCDNLKCAVDRKRGAKPKICSGCHAVLYCSKSCQREDWEEQHRKECDLARVDYKYLGAFRMKYSPNLRSFHTLLTFQKANHSLPKYEAENPGGQPGQIFIMDTWNFKPYTYETYPYFHRLFERDGSAMGDHYFDSRVRKLLKEYAVEGGASQGIRIVEGLYKFGDRGVFTMIKMQLEAEPANPEEPYRLVSSVSRIGPLRPPRIDMGETLSTVD